MSKRRISMAIDAIQKNKLVEADKIIKSELESHLKRRLGKVAEKILKNAFNRK